MKKTEAMTILADALKCSATPSDLSRKIGITSQAISLWPEDLNATHLRNIAGWMVHAGRRIPAEIVAAMRGEKQN